MSTVTGAIQLPSQGVFVGSILFHAEWAPLADDPYLITDQDILVTTDVDGNFSQTFAYGRYRVTVGNSRHFHIAVPDDALSYNILDLIIEEFPSAPIVPWVPGSGMPVATPTEFGAVKISSADADPVVLLVQDGVYRTPANGSVRFKDGKHLQLYNETTGLWNTVWCVGADGAVQIQFGPGEA